MSLINDALRRASQTEKERSRPIGRPLEMEAAPIARHSRLPLILGVGGVIALLAAAWFLWRGANAKVEEPRPVTPPPAAEPAHTVMAPVVAPAVVVPAKAAPVVPPIVSPPLLTNVVSNAWPANLKLTGIFFNRSNPHALFGGQTVGVGDVVDGARVVKIEKDQISVEWEGQIKIITMGAP